MNKVITKHIDFGQVAILIFLAIAMSACATARTRTSDHVLRVAIDADSITPGSYARLQSALFDSGKFIVIDRSSGFRAIAKEQEIQHGTTRFDSVEKYALWGKMYGVGGIIIGFQQCLIRQKAFFHQNYLECVETLSLLNSTTGEVMSIAEVKADAEDQVAPEWTEAVELLVKKYPKHFATRHDLNRTVNYDSSLTEYREKTVIENKKPDLTIRAEDTIKR